MDGSGNDSLSGAVIAAANGEGWGERGEGHGEGWMDGWMEWGAGGGLQSRRRKNITFFW